MMRRKKRKKGHIAEMDGVERQEGARAITQSSCENIHDCIKE